jgi:predicted amidohydrolase
MIKIAAAQIAPVAGNVEQNIDTHCKLIRQSADLGADLVFFPELSLTGYEPALAKKLALSTNDPRLDVFQHLSEQHRLVIGLGLPTSSEQGTFISMLFFQPGQKPVLYSKQHLHSDELPFFVPGNKQVILQVKNFSIAPAICYESLLPEHAEKVAQQGAQIYLASVAKSANGLLKAQAHFPKIARELKLNVVMANCVGPCDDFVSVGGSGIWGKVEKALDKESDVLLILEIGEP